MSFLNEWKNNVEYFQLLKLMARLSKLYSNNVIPFLHYRVTENLFCKYYSADNLSRTDTAFDAKKDNFGVGIKTFQLSNNTSKEKVAEFNKISNQLKKYKGRDLAYQIAIARNERIELGKRLYSITDGCYHIIGRVPEGLVVFNSIYPMINIDKIHSVKDNGKVLQFADDRDFYSYNFSKSTLYKQFNVSEEKMEIPVSIIKDPYEILRALIEGDYKDKYKDVYGIHKIIQDQITNPQKQLILGYNFVTLPLFSEKFHKVPEKSGLNQWNANGRRRKLNEVYIPIPVSLHKTYPNFFPSRDTPFNLLLPNGKVISAKVCQDGGKALMSNPNSDLGQWILRDVLLLKEGELLTLDLLDRLGFNSVTIYKDDDLNYRIDVCTTDYQGY